MDRDKAKPKRYPTRGRARAFASTMEEVWEAEFCVAIARARPWKRGPAHKFVIFIVPVMGARVHGLF